MREGCIAGLSLSSMEEMTWGEIVDTVSAVQERQRQQAQTLASIAYQLAGLTAQAVLSGKLPELYEVFPFWSEQEIAAIKLERFRQIMWHHAAQPIEGEHHR